MIDPKRVLRSVCDDLRFDVNVYNNAYKVYEMSMRKSTYKKHNMFALVAGSLYFHCKSTGKPVVLSKILELIPDTDQEQVMAVYSDLKRDTLG